MDTIPERYRNYPISGLHTHGRLLKVEWSDGMIGSFPLAWLKDSAVDEPATFHVTPSLKARTLTLQDFDVAEVPSTLSIGENGASVEVIWEQGNVSASFPSSWLRFRNPSDAEARAERQSFYFRPIETWGKKEADEMFANSWKWEEILDEGWALHDCLLQLSKNGLVVIDAPPTKGIVNRLIKLLNYAAMTHFEYEWCVDIKPDPVNLGYTTNRIGLHTDEPALESPPSVMALHFVIQAGQGGETELADGFHVSKLLKEEQPEAYELLSKYPLEFLDEGGDGRQSWDLLASHRVIQLDDEGRQKACFFSGHQRGWFFGDLPAHRIPDMYQALKLFNAYAYQPRNLYRRKMTEGEMILIANNRLLHGRTGIQPGDARSVEGCYFDWDVIHSKIRFLRDKIAHPDNQPSF